MNLEESCIEQFYKNSNIFITGATGFMGKVLIEKLLRSTELNTIYLLIRNKKGKNVDERSKELFNNPIFSKLKQDCPNFFHKVKLIEGNIEEPDLGIKITDKQKIITNVNIIFHVAATVKFNEELKIAYNINVNAAKSILRLAKQIINLKSIVHVSTAYSNCYLPEIQEKVYDLWVTYEQVENELEKYNDEELISRYMGKFPNTYTFTKALAECFIRDNKGDLPIGIFRPSIVIPTYKEPVEGWIDSSVQGPQRVCVGVSTGWLRIFYTDGDTLADLVPADKCISGLIAVAWDIYTKKQRSLEMTVYNFVSSKTNTLTWKEYVFLINYFSNQYPYIRALWKPILLITNNYYTFLFLTGILHGIPAIFLKILTKIMGRKARVVKTYQQFFKLNNALKYFCTNSWVFENYNIKKLWMKMNGKDKELFPMDCEQINWLNYYKNYVLGIRRYILHDSDSTLDNARKKLKWYTILNEVLIYLYRFIVGKLFFDLIF